MGVRVAVALGSNLGDREAHLDAACRELRRLLPDLQSSRYRDTEPVGVGPQPRYLNAAVVGTASLGARELLKELLAIEHRRGRVRLSLAAPRTLDLDLILYGDTVADEPGLTVPHPRFRERAFVLEPLDEIAPDLVDPVSGRTVRELFDRLRTSG